VTIIGQTSILNMQHAMDLYHVENDRYPKNYEEFMSEIIKANNIALPVLPEYQKYGYDEKEHKLDSRVRRPQEPAARPVIAASTMIVVFESHHQRNSSLLSSWTGVGTPGRPRNRPLVEWLRGPMPEPTGPGTL